MPGPARSLTRRRNLSTFVVAKYPAICFMNPPPAPTSPSKPPCCGWVDRCSALQTPNSSSVAKGETLKDTIKMVSNYADVVVMRTPWEGSAKAASLYSAVPVVNAGDGGHMHPTQTMADLTTITRLRGKVDGLCIGLCGDLKNGRTVHSLIKAMAKFNDIKFFLISPRELAVPEYMRVFMREHNMWYTEVTGLEPVIPQLDVLYMTRIQKERFVDPLEYERNKGIYILTRRKLAASQARHAGHASPAPSR